MLKEYATRAAAAVLAVPLGVLDFGGQCAVEFYWARYIERNPYVADEYIPSSPNLFRCIADMYKFMTD